MEEFSEMYRRLLANENLDFSELYKRLLSESKLDLRSLTAIDDLTGIGMEEEILEGYYITAIVSYIKEPNSIIRKNLKELSKKFWRPKAATVQKAVKKALEEIIYACESTCNTVDGNPADVNTVNIGQLGNAIKFLETLPKGESEDSHCILHEEEIVELLTIYVQNWQRYDRARTGLLKGV